MEKEAKKVRLTWRKQNGTWGIAGVELAALPPKVYGALCKLRDIENLIERLNDPETPDYEAEDLMKELMGKA